MVSTLSNTSGTQSFTGLAGGYYFVEVTDANGCVATTAVVSLYDYVSIGKYRAGSTVACGCAQINTCGTLYNTYLQRLDYNSYVLNSNCLATGMQLYGDTSGGVWGGSSRVYDMNAGSVFNVSGGLVGTIREYC